MNKPKFEMCPVRHENGNCQPMGGFCQHGTSYCIAVRNAYDCGFYDGEKEALRRAPLPDNKALTVDCCGTCGHCDSGDGAPCCDNPNSPHYTDCVAETDGCMWYKRRPPEKEE